MPTDIINSFTSAIGSFFDNAAVQFGLRAAAVYVAVVWLAAAYWAFRDMQSRSENPIVPYLAAALIILFTPILFPFAIVVYRVIRPQERLGEVYERNLAEEAILAQVDATREGARRPEPATAARTRSDVSLERRPVEPALSAVDGEDGSTVRRGGATRGMARGASDAAAPGR